jgi:transcriptional regulator with XRE-family HTH domain
MKACGRPLRIIIATSVVIETLATDMVNTRKLKKKTLKDISEATHYSISALSQATSGKDIPSFGIIEAYAAALDVDSAPWQRLRGQALAERRPPEKKGKSKDTGSDSSGGSSSGSGPAGQPSPQDGNATADRSRKETKKEVVVDEMAMRVQTLVSEAVQQITPQLHGSPTANMLSLCTVPGDLIELLNETRHRHGISLQDIVRQTPKLGVSISKSSLQKLLASQDLPSAEVLGAILAACGIPDRDVQFWLYHRARLELARERSAHRDDGHQRQVRTVSYATRTQLQLMTILPMIASAVTIVTVLIFGR